MHLILIELNNTIIQNILSKNNISFKLIGYNNIYIDEKLSLKLIDEIYSSSNVHIITNNNILYNSIINPIIVNNDSNNFYKPIDILNFYNFEFSLNLEKINIAIIELEGGFDNNDLLNYWNSIELTDIRPTINVFSIDGATNNPGNIEKDYQVYSDIEIIGSIYPNSNINVYFANNNYISFFNAIATAINDNNNKYICISWYDKESNFDNNTLIAFNTLFKMAIDKGITICTSQKSNINFPASSPNVISIDNLENIIEYNDWKDILNITKNNINSVQSTYFSIEDHQKSIFTNNNYRTVSDVLINGDFLIYIKNNYYKISGLSTSLWTSLLVKYNIKYNEFINELYNNSLKNIIPAVSCTSGFTKIDNIIKITNFNKKETIDRIIIADINITPVENIFIKLLTIPPLKSYILIFSYDKIGEYNIIAQYTNGNTKFLGKYTLTNYIYNKKI